MKIKVPKIPWWLKSRHMGFLVIVIILFAPHGQLFWPGLSLLLYEQGILSALGTILAIASLSQLVGSLCVRHLIKRWIKRGGAKRAVQTLLVGAVVPDILLVVAVQNANIYLYYLSLGLSPGITIACSSILQNMLREQLAEDQMTGSAKVKFITKLIAVGYTWLCFQVESLVWTYLFVFLKISIFCIMSFVKPDAAEPQEQQSLREMWSDPASRIVAGGFCTLFVFYCFGILLPLAGVVDKKQVGTLLLVTMLLTALISVKLSTIVNRRRSTSSSWLIMICRTALFTGLGLMLVLDGSWTVIGAIFWGFGVCGNDLTEHCSYNNAKDRVRGTSAYMVAWNLACVIGGIYVWFMNKIGVSPRTAMEWLLLPAIASVIFAFFQWKDHRLPPKEAKLAEGESGE
ncbi:hypothetical protein SAMN05444392_101337 [Seinonella peptonophila]|uniref:Major Facilitator Superfamily protein n=1 Tax=Seinonella peptonophila TaxID=112248 RepID=A0A1M4T6X0_9BACL|nr:hypothetical protein [Seinonella peptonophila]SHE40201.1 hypothetical protein SAMN05444392_101337 [Seinonella peptonophila]